MLDGHDGEEYLRLRSPSEPGRWEPVDGSGGKMAPEPGVETVSRRSTGCARYSAPELAPAEVLIARSGQIRVVPRWTRLWQAGFLIAERYLNGRGV